MSRFLYHESSEVLRGKCTNIPHYLIRQQTPYVIINMYTNLVGLCEWMCVWEPIECSATPHRRDLR